MALAVYVGYESTSDLVSRKASAHSVPGISLGLCFPHRDATFLSGKEEGGQGTRKRGYARDAKQTDVCVYLSVILLIGLLLNAGPGWWWADPTAALIMVPLVANQG